LDADFLGVGALPSSYDQRVSRRMGLEWIQPQDLCGLFRAKSSLALSVGSKQA